MKILQSCLKSSLINQDTNIVAHLAKIELLFFEELHSLAMESFLCKKGNREGKFFLQNLFCYLIRLKSHLENVTSPFKAFHSSTKYGDKIWSTAA